MTQDAERNTQNETGPAAGDFGSLKNAAAERIRAGELAGINPHKVLRLCREFEELKEQLSAVRRRAIRTLEWMVADARHRFDDCRNNFEVSNEDGTEGLAEGGYSPELTEAMDLLAELEKGVRIHSDDTLAAVYKKGFADARMQILNRIRNIDR